MKSPARKKSPTRSVDKENPLYVARPAAGFPGMAEDGVEEMLNLHTHLVTHPEATFFVRATGDSMEGVGIFSGDILVVDRSLEPRHGSIVVAVFDGGFVVKQLQGRHPDYQLVSANEQYPPIRIADHDNCFIWGVVSSAVHKFA